MFKLRLVISALHGTLKYIVGIPIMLGLAGLPFLWALFQRMRLKKCARQLGWSYCPRTSSSSHTVLKKNINGYNVEIWPNDSFGAKIFVYFKSKRKLDLETGRPSSRPKKINPFTTPNSNFNALFGSMRAGKNEISALQNDPEAVEAVVRFRSRWMFYGGDLNMGSDYMLMYMRYGTPVGYYLPPRVLDQLSKDAVMATSRFEDAFK